jgi:ketosteroid isomerase-like protein
MQTYSKRVVVILFLIAFIGDAVIGCASLSGQLLLQDKDEIKGLITTYAWACDNKDMKRLMSIFTDDAHVAYPAGKIDARGIKEVEGFYQKIFAANELMKHKIVNVYIQVEGNTATGGAYFVAAIRRANGSVIMEGQYSYKFVKKGGRWLMSEEIIDRNYSMPEPRLDKPLDWK